jgi:hypothetical protein
MQTTAPSRSSGSRGGFTLILLLFAFAGGIVATLWALPAAKRWWNGDETVASADNAAQALLSEDTEDGKTQQTAPPPSSMEVAALEARLAAVSARLDAISTQADGAGGNAARAEGLLIAFATRRALDRGSPLGYLEGELRLRFGGSQPRAVSTIINTANSPVTLADLQSGLDEVAPLLTGTSEKRDWWTAAKKELANLIVIRKAGEESPVPQKAIERAKLLLSAERVDNAVEEIERLPDREEADEWLQMARKYNEARRALDVIEAAAILEPRSIPVTARPAGQTNVQAAPPPPAVMATPDPKAEAKEE